MGSCAPTKYKTKNWSSYNDSLKQRGSLSIWFDPEMVWTPPSSGKRGRQRQFSDAAIQTCLTMKVLFGMPLRQTNGLVQSLLRLVGLDWVVPDFSTLCRRQKTQTTLNVNLSYRGSSGPLNLLIDSTGIKAEGEGPLSVMQASPAGQWMHCIKLLGQSLMARDFDRQVAEIQIRFAVLNRYTALGIPVTEPVG
ncbi:hypothetical protein PH5382_02905 [Phaeobacter sp. CECT 5382]|uniref:IS5 family transposase n=1 Tax=Phaeobacter sp. CECT 5382 TaxID=1712645 RepID=UPI0006D94F5D|nr:IS5 family transposase [Phaeobacter sp. CECT 5382]CUH88961.1 hypothetical protein PH5382_02905 [Phaeobacter sp. CECT 5382]